MIAGGWTLYMQCSSESNTAIFRSTAWFWSFCPEVGDSAYKVMLPFTACAVNLTPSKKCCQRMLNGYYWEYWQQDLTRLSWLHLSIFPSRWAFTNPKKANLWKLCQRDFEIHWMIQIKSSLKSFTFDSSKSASLLSHGHIFRKKLLRISFSACKLLSTVFTRWAFFFGPCCGTFSSIVAPEAWTTKTKLRWNMMFWGLPKP